MIINIFPYGIKHAFKGHNMHVRPNTVTEYGAEFMCRTCLKTDYMTWNAPMQRINAQVYLNIKNNAVLKMIKDKEQ